jgi:hypothetical protein
MSRFAFTALAVFTLAQPALSVPGDKSTDSRAKPSSFVPHAQTNSHVYGAPIGPPVVGHSKVSHQKASGQRPTPKRRSTTPRKRVG